MLIGATRQHFVLIPSNTTKSHMHKVNMSLTHRFSFMSPPAAVEFWQRRPIFICTCTDWCYKTTFCTQYHPTQLKTTCTIVNIITYTQVLYYVSCGCCRVLTNKANLHLNLTDYNIHTDNNTSRGNTITLYPEQPPMQTQEKHQSLWSVDSKGLLTDMSII